MCPKRQGVFTQRGSAPAFTLKAVKEWGSAPLSRLDASVKDYHKAWLSAHADRTEKWLCQQLADGFDVHHIDGDRANNAPFNLVLIERADHTRLHRRSTNLLRSLPDPTPARLARVEAEGGSAYRARANSGGWAGQARSSVRWARMYADLHQLAWPPIR